MDYLGNEDERTLGPDHTYGKQPWVANVAGIGLLTFLSLPLARA
jgi:hypothetical protein